MPLDLQRFVGNVEPESCILFLGAGSSIPSGAPSVDKLIGAIANKAKIDSDGLSLREISTLVEKKISSRRDVVQSIRPFFDGLRPSRGLLNVALYKWKGIYTTNYDGLVEQAFKAKGVPLQVYSSNFDFSQQEMPGASKLYKLHGTIEKDVVDGNQSRLIITDGDYELAGEYREQLYDRLKADFTGAHLIIVGYSLSDQHIKDLIERAIKISANVGSERSITILVYQRDENRAALLEDKGLQVVFSGIDEFFAELARKSPSVIPAFSATGNPLDAAPVLNALTKDVSHAISTENPNVGSMFNGWPASYADIKAGLTFDRTVSGIIASKIESGAIRHAVIVGASGVGKTTAARQVMSRLAGKALYLWEHDTQTTFVPDAWRAVAERLATEGKRGVLFVDEASAHVTEINRLIDSLPTSVSSLSIVLASAKASWAPRIKSVYLYRFGEEFNLKKLDGSEIDRLLTLIDNSSPISILVENSFKGFSRYERRRRLVERCESDFFVCLRNVFASEKFDDIVLREYASLERNSQEVYKLVATLQSAGVMVHRQLVIRLLNIPADHISAVLASLSDVVVEKSIDIRQGIYGWIGRHQVISEIISQYKFSDQGLLYELLVRVVEQTSPTYHVEVRSLRELCNSAFGVPRLTDRNQQNVILRMMMSVVPGERVPRHKLIRNLIALGEFEEAATEIRIFEKDFREDGPVSRYKIDLMVARAETSQGLLREDRVAILRDAQDYAVSALQRFGDNKYVIYAYAQLGIRWYKFTGDTDVFDAALDELRKAEERMGDPEISTMIARLSRTLSSSVSEVIDGAQSALEGE